MKMNEFSSPPKAKENSSPKKKLLVKNRDWVQNPHFNDRITQTIVSCPLWRLVTREKHSRA
jgi:hypothetical protein